MSTFLFDGVIFGPVNSRRLGASLGINLLPRKSKLCNFNCLYCECGLTPIPTPEDISSIPSREKVRIALELKLANFRNERRKTDTITFAGNGEPTLHPEFPGIIDDTIELRNKYFPDTQIAVLSNATLLSDEAIREALMKVDLNILKLDSAVEETIRKINCPKGKFSLIRLIDDLKQFEGNFIIQTLFLKGEYNGYTFDNTTSSEIAQWMAILKILNPKQVMIYSLDRDTPVESLQKISEDKLNEIARSVENAGISVQVFS